MSRQSPKADVTEAPRYRVSVPGRTEVAGNHQDHQGGCVIASAIDKRIECEVSKRQDSLVVVQSQGYKPFTIDLGEADFWTPRKDERETTVALVRGMAAQIAQHGIDLVGCTLDMHSSIPSGAGLSSSAAFELCVGAALMSIAGCKMQTSSGNGEAEEGEWCMSPLHLAQMALHAERAFFGKPCGIMDQMACAFGGVIHLDFKNRINPVVTRVELPPSCDGYAYYLVDCGSGHETLTASFAQVAQDMQAAADAFDVAQLRDITREDYLSQLARVRVECGDLVALRGLAFFEEFDLVARRYQALLDDDASRFVRLANMSGVVSAEYLQNVSMPGQNEEAMVALALCRCALEDVCCGLGAKSSSARIHGGGFGGTIQAIVPMEASTAFCERIEKLLGPGSCMEAHLGAPGITIEEL